MSCATDNSNNVNKNRNGLFRNVLVEILGPTALDIKWSNVIVLSILHVAAVWIFLTFPYIQKWKLFLWNLFIGGVNAFGITGGVHRLWSHRSYKANLPLRIILMISFSMAGQNSIHDWVRDHRIHHKYTETSADPHNAKRGFFFSHVGWLLMKKHPDVIRRGNELDMSDVLADPVVQFHEKHYLKLKLFFTFILPSIIPPLLWEEDWYWSILTLCVFRYCLSLNFTWLVNSAAHLWGHKPYDQSINPSENLAVSVLSMGEGWHNYHHTFPWDYKAAELGKYSVNLTTFWIDFFAKIGWAYDLRAPSRKLVERVIIKSGDGSHQISRQYIENNNNNNLSY